MKKRCRTARFRLSEVSFLTITIFKVLQPVAKSRFYKVTYCHYLISTQDLCPLELYMESASCAQLCPPICKGDCHLHGTLSLPLWILCRPLHRVLDLCRGMAWGLSRRVQCTSFPLWSYRDPLRSPETLQLQTGGHEGISVREPLLIFPPPASPPVSHFYSRGWTEPSWHAVWVLDVRHKINLNPYKPTEIFSDDIKDPI